MISLEPTMQQMIMEGIGEAIPGIILIGLMIIGYVIDNGKGE